MIRLFWLICLLASTAQAGAQEGAQDGVLSAKYADRTTRYPHGVLGDTVEYGSLLLTTKDGQTRIALPVERVFEDVAPRLVDVDGDGDFEVVVVESEARSGAQLAIYDESGKIAETPHIGTRFRWLAPIGAADLDGDGFVEIAYIDRPHLAKTLRIWRFRDGALRPVASLPGFTNHRIGEVDIAGGIRDCGTGPEMVMATANWRQVVAVTFDSDGVTVQEISPHQGRDSFAAALACS